MKSAFDKCYRAVFTCRDVNGRPRRELFMDLPARKTYPDYYEVIENPISMRQINKRSSGGYYKTVQQYQDDWKLMFDNARAYNQEGSTVYNDAEEMEKVFDATFEKAMGESGLPGFWMRMTPPPP
ncbi:Bromodomain-containing protein [Hymenopellis radicata]|nr:Bromodomain-containing protein [Hymenopellis radicata]